jgi:hypothetical protein
MGPTFHYRRGGLITRGRLVNILIFI